MNLWENYSMLINSRFNIENIYNWQFLVEFKSNVIVILI